MRPKDLAKQVLKLYWDRKVPVDVFRVAKKMGTQVLEDIDLAFENVSGCVAVENGNPVIRYNPTDISVRQRFTIAHEIGHLALHGVKGSKKFRDPSKHFSLDNFSVEESEANRFAAELLMPEEAISQVIKDTESPSTKALAKTFAVSEVAMRFRLKNLGWLK